MAKRIVLPVKQTYSPDKRGLVSAVVNGFSFTADMVDPNLGVPWLPLHGQLVDRGVPFNGLSATERLEILEKIACKMDPVDLWAALALAFKVADCFDAKTPIGQFFVFLESYLPGFLLGRLAQLEKGGRLKPFGYPDEQVQELLRLVKFLARKLDKPCHIFGPSSLLEVSCVSFLECREKPVHIF